jgi:hypothetical protein
VSKNFHFTRHEAYSKIGTRVRLKYGLFSVGTTPAVREGTFGTVEHAEPLAPGMEMRKPSDFVVKVVWNFQGRPPSMFSEPIGQYTKDEFERHFESIDFVP